jgi:hypothetical protein
MIPARGKGYAPEQVRINWWGIIFKGLFWALITCLFLAPFVTFIIYQNHKTQNVIIETTDKARDIENLLDAFARTLTWKDVLANEALFCETGTIDFHRLMSFLSQMSFLGPSAWGNEMTNFQATFRSNHMTLNNQNTTFFEAHNASVVSLGYFEYALDIQNQNQTLPFVKSSFSAIFNLTFASEKWCIQRAEVLNNVTHALVYGVSSGAEVFSSGSKKKKDLSQWNLLLDQVTALYYQQSPQAALSVCRTNYYQDMAMIYGTGLELCALITAPPPVLLNAPLVCDAFSTIDVASCLPNLNMTLSGNPIFTINAITPLLGDLTLLGGPGIEVTGHMHALQFTNVGVLSVSVGTLPPEFTVATTFTNATGHVEISFQKATVALGNQVWASSATGALNSIPEFRYLVEQDIPLLGINTHLYGILDVQHGGTGINQTLIGGRVMYSSMNQTIIEGPALGAQQLLSGSGPLTLIAGDGIQLSFVGSSLNISANHQEVTNIGLIAPSDIFLVTSTNITSTGNLTFVVVPQAPHTFWRGPSSGSSSQVPFFGSIVAADLPLISLTTGVTGILPIANGGTNSGTALNGGRLMWSSLSGSIQEAPALSNGELFIGYTGSPPQVGTIQSDNLSRLTVSLQPGLIVLSPQAANLSDASGYVSVMQGGTGQTSPVPNGYLLIGSSLSPGSLVAAPITAGPGIVVSNGPGSIGISALGTCPVGQQFSQSCINIDGKTCSVPLDNTCMSPFLNAQTLNVQGTASLGLNTVCDAPVSINCIPTDGLHFGSITVDTLTVLNYTIQNTNVFNGSSLSADDFFVQNIHLIANGSMVCESGSMIDNECMPQHLIVDQATIIGTLHVSDVHCTTPINQTCLDISSLTCLSPVDSSCLPARIMSINGLLPNSSSLDFELIAGQGIALTNLANGIILSNTGVLSVGLSAPSDLFSVSGSPVTSMGTLSFVTKVQSPHTFWAGPSVSGPSGLPSFRNLVIGDLPVVPAGEILIGTGMGTTSANITSGTGISIIQGTGYVQVSTSALLDVSLTVPAGFLSVNQGTISTSGQTFAITLVNQTQRTFFAGPLEGNPNAPPTFRLQDISDLPHLPLGYVYYGTGAGTSVTTQRLEDLLVTSFTLDMPSDIFISFTPDNAPGTVVVNVTFQSQVPGYVLTADALGVPHFQPLNYSVDLTFPSDLLFVSNGPLGSTGGTLNMGKVPQFNNLFYASSETGFGISLPTFRSIGFRDFIPLNLTQAQFIGGTSSGVPAAMDFIAGTGMVITKTDAGVIFSSTTDPQTIGTVTSVGISFPGMLFNISPTVITHNGTFVITPLPQLANHFFAGPVSGISGIPSMRTIDVVDLPNLSFNQIYLGDPSTGLTSVTTLTAGNAISITTVAGVTTIDSTFQVALSMPASIFSVSGSPVTNTGTFTVSLVPQAARLFFASPVASPGLPLYRTIELSDLPPLLDGEIWIGSAGVAVASTLSAGSGITITPGMGTLTVTANLASVSVNVPTYMTVSPSTLSSSGTFTFSFNSQAANLVFASPGAAAGVPSFRSLVSNDIPNLSTTKLTSGVLPIARGGTNSGTTLLNGRLMVSSGGAIVEAATMSNGFLPIGNGAGYTFAALTAGSGISIVNSAGGITISSTAVTSISMTVPAAFLSVTPSTITSSGTFAVSLNSQTQNLVFASPDGASGTPSFRSLVANDIPSLDTSKLTTGILPIARGGTNSGTALNNGRLMVSSAGSIIEAASMANGVLPIGNGAGYTFSTLTAGSGITITNTAGGITIAATGGGGGSGTVTSIGVTVPSFLLVSPSSITTSGTFAFSLTAQAQNTVFAAPNGSAGTPSFRSLVANDIPNLDTSKLTSGILPIARGGTNSGTSLSNGRLMVSSAGSIVEAASMANGALPIGNGAGYTFATLTAGTGVTIANAAGSITISATASDTQNADGQSCVFEEFVTADSGTGGYLHGNSVSFTITTSGTSAGASPDTTYITSSSGANAQGVLALSTGTTSNGRVSIMQGPSMLLAGLSQLTFTTRARISAMPTGSQTYIGYIGFMNTPAAGVPNNGCYFKVDLAISSTNWIAVCRASGSENRIDTGVAASSSAFQVLNININSAGTSAAFSINGSSVGSISSNVPSGAGQFFGVGYKMQKSVGTTARLLYIDYMQWCAVYSGTRS